MDKKLLDLCYKKHNKELNISWDDLASQYGYKSGEALRSKFKKYRKSKGDLPSKEIVRDASIEKRLTELDIKEMNLKKERVRLGDIRASINKEITKLARKEALNDLIRESIKDLSPIIFKQPEHQFGEENEMVIQFSDSHFGMTVDNAFEVYNENVFVERLANYTLQILNIKKKEKVNTCHLCFSGDNLSGIIHPGIVRNNQYGIVEQTKRFSEYASMFIEKLSNHFENVYVYFVTGNHSRPTEAKQDSLNKDRYENFVLEFIKLRTENLNNISYIHSILDNTVSEFYVKGHYCCLCHGDYDVPKQAPNKLYSLLGKKPNFIFLGHRHIFEVLTIDRTKVITSGAWLTHDEFCTDHRLVGEPSQTVTIISEQGLICAYDVKLK